MRLPCRSFLIVVASLMAAGCGESGPKFPPPVPVSGKVTLKGQPVTGGTVRFVPSDAKKARPGFGRIQSDGSYKAQTEKPDDGLIPGTYTVFVEPAEPTDKSQKVVDTIPVRYISPGTSGLTQQIDKATDVANIDLR